jgi:pimeloyl-ACP methyl ester carboxylesterase
MKITALSIILLAVAAISPAYFDYADSPEFYLDLLTYTPGRPLGFADSRSFYLNAYPVNRGWADSESFSFDWLANTAPVYGPMLPPGEIARNNNLRQYKNNAWSMVLDLPAAGDTVIIINHGWNSEPEEFIDLAGAIQSELPHVYIYAWDWGDGQNTKSDANPNGLHAALDFLELTSCARGVLSCLRSASAFAREVETTRQNAHSHGRQLGETLMGYGILPSQHNIHMIGHSFGGIVCAEAAKKLYAKTGVKVKQLTTLDTPNLPGADAVKSIDPKTFEHIDVIYYDWMDDLHLAATGGPLKGDYPHVLNLKLNPAFNAIFPLHSKAVDWYELSASSSAINCLDNRYGFGWSFAWNPNNPYWDIVGFEEELYGYGHGCLITWQEIADIVTEAVIDTAKETFNSAASWVGNKAVVVVDSVGNLVTTSARLTFATGISAMDEQLKADTPPEAYLYKNIDIPADSEQVVFDYRFVTAGAGDFLTLSIEGEPVITIDVEAAGVSAAYTTSYPASVREYAGQNVLVQFTLRPDGEGTTDAYIDNLRFIKITLPGDINGDKMVDVDDLVLLCEQWMYSPGTPSADIAPHESPDQWVDFKDVSLLSAHWLEGTEQ